LETWNDIEPFLCRDWKLIRLDLKGFGLSAKPRDRAYGIFDQAAVVSAFIRHMGLDGYVLCGHSFGGTVAMTTFLSARDTSNRAGALVLLDAPCYLQELPFFVKVLRIPLLNRLCQSLPPPRFRAASVLSRIFSDKSRVTPERIDRYAKYLDLPGIHDSLIACASQIVPEKPEEVSARIRDVDVPTLILWGQNDNVIDLWQGERLRKEIKNARLEILPDCGHMPHEERPEEVAMHLGEFIRSVLNHSTGLTGSTG
jgi:pimeloyl-ACP methyl ester carboxylesterase